MSATRCVPHVIAQAIQTLLLSSVLLTNNLLAVSQAQMTLDGSLGPQGPLVGPHYRIDAELGQIRGSNLFHSFGQFNVGTGESATFTGPSMIANIVGRVTGGRPSSIDGQLKSEIAGANLFLLNPSGVMFGPHTSLDVSGAFHVSTADVLRFADGTTFSAHLSGKSVLTVAPPAAFGFLGANPAPITFWGGSLHVPVGQTLSVVGGDIEIVGNGLLTADSVPTLDAPGGRIHITSVAAAGEVPVNLPEFNVDSFVRLGRVALSQGAFINASGDGGGAVFIRSGRLVVDGSFIFADNLGDMAGIGLGVDLRVTEDAVIAHGAAITTDSLGAGRARDLRITAGSVLMDAAGIGSTPFASGDGGNIVVHVGHLTLTGGALMTISTQGLGRGGALTIAATDTIVIAGHDSDGTPSAIISNASNRGDAGRVFVSAPTLHMDGGLIQAVTACESCGNAGEIEVRGGRFTLTGGAQIDSSTSGVGQGGALTVVATDTLAITGSNREGNLSGLFGTAFSSGAAGRLFIAAPTVSIDGGRIQSRSEGDGNAGAIVLEVGRLTLTGGAQVSSSTLGLARGGALSVVATDMIAITGRDSEGNPSGLFSAAQGPGLGGDLRAAASHFQLSNGGTISASSSGTGDAGTVLIQAGETFRSQHGAVTTATERSGGGAITLNAGSLIWLTDDSVITTTVRGGGGDAGNITTNSQFSILAGSQIVANAFEGRGGNISIQAQQVFLADLASTVSASSALGINGQVNIQAPVTSISGSVAPLPESFARAAELLRDRCVARLRDRAMSRFVLGGRDGVPLEPGSWLPSSLGSPGPQPPGDSAQTQHERRLENVGILRIDHMAQTQVKGHYAHARWPEALDVECTRWMGQ